MYSLHNSRNKTIDSLTCSASCRKEILGQVITFVFQEKEVRTTGEKEIGN